jgi:hypothetical protein
MIAIGSHTSSLEANMRVTQHRTSWVRFLTINSANPHTTPHKKL